MSHWLISPGKTSLETSFQDFVALRHATGMSHPDFLGRVLKPPETRKSPDQGRGIFVVPAEGFEPPTPGSEDQCSNPLSYAGIIATLVYHLMREVIWHIN